MKPELTAKTPASAKRETEDSKRVHLPLEFLDAFQRFQRSPMNVSRARIVTSKVRSIVLPANIFELSPLSRVISGELVDEPPLAKVAGPVLSFPMDR